MTNGHTSHSQETPSGQNRVGFEARRIAARLLGLIVDEGHSLAAICDNASGNAAYRALITKDRAMVRAILTTALRNRGAILAVMKSVMDRPEPKRARDLTHILHVAAAQVLFMELPDSAAVNLGVAAIAANRNTQRFRGFANAILRRIGREKETLLKGVIAQAPVMSEWLRKQVRQDFGKQNLLQIEEMILLEPYLDVSVQTSRSTQGWMRKLDAVELATGSLRLTNDTPVHKLEGYQQGAWWVQNAAASIPARLFGNVEGLDVADLCAAPGGKSAQLASAGANVTVVDNSESRLARLVENFQRLELEGNIVCANILKWEPSQKFDCVLLDAPCTSTGTLRRHPDVMWAKNEDEVRKLGSLQRLMFEKAISLTKPGGTVVFATCSLVKAEGEDVFAHILKNNTNIELAPVTPEEVGGISEIINGQGAIRCLPHHLASDPKRLGGLDGFFAGRIKVL